MVEVQGTWNNKWVKAGISLVTFAIILVIEFTTREALFAWSITAIIDFQNKHSDSMKYFWQYIVMFGGQAPNLFVIFIFVAMFKRRHQAFSYVSLWCAQIFLEVWFKLCFHEARPPMVFPPETRETGAIKWIPAGQIISLGTPSGTALSSMCIALSVVIEHIYHTEEQSEHNNLRLSIPKNNRFSS